VVERLGSFVQLVSTPSNFIPVGPDGDEQRERLAREVIPGRPGRRLAVLGSGELVLCRRLVTVLGWDGWIPDGGAAMNVRGLEESLKEYRKGQVPTCCLGQETSGRRT
jgi:hypothetical protein